MFFGVEGRVYVHQFVTGGIGQRSLSIHCVSICAKISFHVQITDILNQ
jgi:hypothetical protein